MHTVGVGCSPNGIGGNCKPFAGSGGALAGQVQERSHVSGDVFGGTESRVLDAITRCAAKQIVDAEV